MIAENISNCLELYLYYPIVCFSNYLISSYVFCRSQSLRLKLSQYIFLIISGVLSSALFVFIRISNYPLSQLARFFVIPILLSLLIKKQNDHFKKIVIGLISFAFVSVIENVAYIVLGALLWVFNLIPSDIVASLLGELFTVIICMCFINIKRLRKGIQFFHQDKQLGLGLLISSIVIILKLLNLRDNQDTDYYFVIAVFGVIIVIFGLYLWVSRSITAHYRERLQLKSEEHYKELLEEKEREIERLNQTNEYLAKIVHRDNHLMNSLNACFGSNNSGELLQEIQTMVQERSELINREQRESKLLPSTGNLLIDNTISELFIKAAAHGIDFDLTVSKPLDEIIGKYISQTDMQTLLSDHIKDAIIAVDSRGEDGGKILVDLSMQDDNYCITIYDSGVEFEIATLERLGIERVTTHADSGGSGIGFMTTFETLKKAYASLMITEFEAKTPFTKSVSFRFDGENSFIIQSYRSNELKENLTREDIVIL